MGEKTWWTPARLRLYGRTASCYSRSARDEARALIADCTDAKGRLDRSSLEHAISDVFVALYGAEGRLPRFRDILTKE